MPQEVFGAYGRIFFDPVFPLIPNDSLYGLGGHSLPWFVSLFIFGLGFLVFFKIALKSIFKPIDPKKWFLLVSFLSFEGAIFFVFTQSLVQYYFPLAILISLGVVEFFVRLKKGLLLLVLLIFFFAFWQTVRVHWFWTNQGQISLIKNILLLSEPDDYVFDMVGYHLFRQSPYWLCCEVFPQFEKNLSRPLPKPRDELKKKQAKFIIKTGRFEALSEEDQVFIEAHFEPTGKEKIFRLKETGY